MLSRRFREGSVGLLILLGLGVFGLIILWLNRFSAARRSYKTTVEFVNAGGMQKGTVVRYRGVNVGSVSTIRPGLNNVEVEIEFTNPDLKIPRNVLVEANQSGLIGESVIEITPKASLPDGTVVAKPLEKNCNPQIIVCNNSRLKGQIGISIDQLVRASTELSTRYSDPKFYSNVNQAVENTAQAASSVAELSRSLTVVSKSFQQQLNGFTATTNSVQRATNQLSSSSTQTLNQISSTANQFSSTAREVRLTANQANKLLNNLDTLVTSNRSSLVTTLNNITQTSNQLRVTVSSLSPTVNRFTQGELLRNLETLSANAAQASANLRNVTNNLNNPNNVLVLQQTLDSARVTFENAQKITSDLDELTGDPAFRDNLRQLVNGLSSLVSSTQQMQQQVQVATSLDSVKATVYKPNAVIPTPNTNQPELTFNLSPLAEVHKPNAVIPTPSTNQQQLIFNLSPLAEVHKPNAAIPTPSTNQQQLIFNPSPTAFKSADKQPQPTTSPLTPSSQENLLKQLREYRDQE